MTIRINKFLTKANFCSRRAADRLIEAKKVRINNRLAILGDKIGERDRVFVEGQEIKTNKTEKIYLAFNKPVGVICTTDKNSPNNIIDYIKYPQRIYPIGRLDVNTSGLILLTNDGEMVNKILKGREMIEKEYLVTVDKSINDDFLKRLEKGVMIDGFRTLPSKTEAIDDKKFSIVIIEGKNRQIRRMCEKLGYNVVGLKRFRIGNLTLDDLKEGKYKTISALDIK